MNRKNEGFSLIELMVVIAIIGILAGTVMLSLGRTRAKGRDTKRVSDMRSMGTAIESYFNEYFGYPQDLETLQAHYVGPLPVAPVPADSTCGQADSGPNTYTYAAGGTVFTSPKDETTQVYPSYSMEFCLGNSVGGYSDGLDANSSVDCALSPTGVTCQ